MIPGYFFIMLSFLFLQLVIIRRGHSADDITTGDKTT